MQDAPNIGDVPAQDAVRDAMHFAVIPAVIGQDSLYPGYRVVIVDGKLFADTDFPHIQAVGIIDPFRKCDITGFAEGDRVWLFLMPNTVTGMRHHWSHPVFDDRCVKWSSPEHGDCHSAGGPKSASEEYLRAYAVRMNRYDNSPEVAFQRLIGGLRSGELFAYGSDLHCLDELDDAQELAKHASIYLGRPVADWGEFEFSCSC